MKGTIKDKYGLLIKPVYVPAVTLTNFYELCRKFKFVKLTESMVYPKDVNHKIGTIPEFVQLNKILSKFEYSETSMFTNKPELDNMTTPRISLISMISFAGSGLQLVRPLPT